MRVFTFLDMVIGIPRYRDLIIDRCELHKTETIKQNIERRQLTITCSHQQSNCIILIDLGKVAFYCFQQLPGS